MHGHYWLSGQVGAVAKERWGVPLVQSMHTLGKVKNAALAAGDAAEPEIRLRGEAEVVAAADRLVANTDDEARQLIGHYDADPAASPPSIRALTCRCSGPGRRRQARRQLGLPHDGVVLVFAGRVQPLKAPDVVLHAAARMIADDPAWPDRLTVAFVGGPSGTGRQDPDGLTELAARLGLAGLVRLEPPCPQPELAQWYRAATLVMVPSYSESFGLVAMEAQACGTPVVAAAVGGLRTAVRHGYSGILVDSRDPGHYARAVRELIAAPAALARLRARRQRARIAVRLVGDRRLAAAAVRDRHRARRPPRSTRERRAGAPAQRAGRRARRAWRRATSPAAVAATWSRCPASTS